MAEAGHDRGERGKPREVELRLGLFLPVTRDAIGFDERMNRATKRALQRRIRRHRHGRRSRERPEQDGQKNDALGHGVKDWQLPLGNGGTSGLDGGFDKYIKGQRCSSAQAAPG
jgi:hypothetical protein